MREISACAEVDPLRKNGTQKTMLIVKSDFGIEDATQLLEQTTNASDVIVYGMAFNPKKPSRDKVWRAILSSLARPTECWWQVDGCLFPREGRLHGEVDAHDSHEQGAGRQHSSQ